MPHGLEIISVIVSDSHHIFEITYWESILLLCQNADLKINVAGQRERYVRLQFNIAFVCRGEGESHIDFKAMIISLVLHLLLLLFEIFVCINLGGSHHFPWRLMFMPLYVLSSLSIVACIWGFRHERSVEVGGNIKTFFKLTMINKCN